jgi:hypothetical protein
MVSVWGYKLTAYGLATKYALFGHIIFIKTNE